MLQSQPLHQCGSRQMLEDAINAIDRARQRSFTSKAWDTVSNDLPLLPLWYPANIVISNKRIGNVKMSPQRRLGLFKGHTVIAG